MSLTSATGDAHESRLKRLYRRYKCLKRRPVKSSRIESEKGSPASLLPTVDGKAIGTLSSLESKRSTDLDCYLRYSVKTGDAIYADLHKLTDLNARAAVGRHDVRLDDDRHILLEPEIRYEAVRG